MSRIVKSQGVPFWPIIRSILLYLVGPLFALLTFLIANNWSFSIEDNHKIELIWVLIAYIAAEHFARIVDRVFSEQEAARDQNEVREVIQETAELFRAELRSSLRVTRLTDETFLSKIENSLKSGYHVKNTYVGISDLTSQGSIGENNILKMYESVLNKDASATWEDVIGVKELFEPRFININKENDLGFLGSHTLYVIDTHAPILNFVLVAPKNSQPNEVFFGWVIGSNADVERFHSTDSRLIRMFEYYFESLRTARNVVGRIAVPYKGDPANRFADSITHRWQGSWLSISGSVKAMPEAGAAANRENKEVSEFAFITISYDHDWKIVGEVFELNMTQKYIFESEMCSIIGNSLYYKFQNKGRYGNVQSEGLGLYSLASDQDTLLGHYARKPYHKASITRAAKLTDSEAAMFKTRSQDGIVKRDEIIRRIIAMPLE